MGVESRIRAGGVRVEFEAGKPKIVAEAVCFSALLHELGKGVMELQSYHGLPEEREVLEAIFKHTENLESELWDLRYGPKIWQMMLKAMNTANGRARLLTLKELYQLPADKFAITMRDLLLGHGATASWLQRTAKKHE